MENTTRIRINLNSREIEFEGSENFIEKYDNVIKEFIEKIKETSQAVVLAEEPFLPANFENLNNRPSSLSLLNGLPDSFGEYYTKFPRNIKVVDKILIASYYAQFRSDEGLFTPKDAADFLTEQNVQITNASAFIKALVSTGKIFRHSGKYKVSEKGVEQVIQMYSSSGS